MDARERTARPLREIFGEVAATYETANRVLTHVRLVVRRVGFLISGSRSGYTYLSSSILKAAGFASVSFERLLFEAAAIHISRRS